MLESFIIGDSKIKVFSNNLYFDTIVKHRDEIYKSLYNENIEFTFSSNGQTTWNFITNKEVNSKNYYIELFSKIITEAKNIKTQNM